MSVAVICDLLVSNFKISTVHKRSRDFGSTERTLGMLDVITLLYIPKSFKRGVPLLKTDRENVNCILNSVL